MTFVLEWELLSPSINRSWVLKGFKHDFHSISLIFDVIHMIFYPNWSLTFKKNCKSEEGILGVTFVEAVNAIPIDLKNSI